MLFNAVDKQLQEDQQGVLVTNRLLNDPKSCWLDIFSDWEQLSVLALVQQIKQPLTGRVAQNPLHYLQLISWVREH